MLHFDFVDRGVDNILLLLGIYISSLTMNTNLDTKEYIVNYVDGKLVIQGVKHGKNNYMTLEELEELLRKFKQKNRGYHLIGERK